MAVMLTQAEFDKLTSAQMKAELAKHKISSKGQTKKAQFSETFAAFLEEHPQEETKAKPPCDCEKCCPPEHYSAKERDAKCGTEASDSIHDVVDEMLSSSTEEGKEVPGTIHILRYMAEDTRNKEADRDWAKQLYTDFANKITKLVEDEKSCGKTRRLATKWGKIQAQVDLKVQEAQAVRKMVYE